MPGFKVPDDLPKTDDILDVNIGTDPYLALKTRRGTGFYKVPSLQGVWFRNAFVHGGQAETLEEWLDPARVQSDYVPNGFHGARPDSGSSIRFELIGDRQTGSDRIPEDALDPTAQAPVPVRARTLLAGDHKSCGIIFFCLNSIKISHLAIFYSQRAIQPNRASRYF